MEKHRDKLKMRRPCSCRIIDGWSISKVADHAQTPQRTMYARWNRFQWNEPVGLLDASRKPNTIHKLLRETVEKILEVDTGGAAKPSNLVSFANIIRGPRTTLKGLVLRQTV